MKKRLHIILEKQLYDSVVDRFPMSKFSTVVQFALREFVERHGDERKERGYPPRCSDVSTNTAHGLCDLQEGSD